MFNFFKKKEKLLKPDVKNNNTDFYKIKQQEQIDLGKESGIDTSIYEDLNPTQMEYVRKILEAGASPNMVSQVVDTYKNEYICEKDFEELCDKSIYIVDIDYLKRQYKIDEKPEYTKKNYLYPAAFYGACFGDIAGSKYEFCFSKDKRKHLNINNCIDQYSNPTDDTILSCATAKALTENIKLDDNEIILTEYDERSTYPFLNNPFTKYYKEYAKMPFPNAGYGSGFMSWVMSKDSLPYGSMGNGSAMRVSPIGEYFDNQDDIIFYSIASAASTHNHPEGIKGAVITAISIWMAKNGYSKEQIFNYIISFYNPKQTKQFIREENLIRNFTMEELRSMRGPAICPFSVPAAAICFNESNSFEDVINNCLSFDGDTDTIGAIAGSIAGVYYGVPENLRKIVDNKKPDKIFDIALNVLNINT